MSPIASSLNSEEIRRKAQTIFEENRLLRNKQTDWLFAGLFLLQWLGAIIIAYCLSPRTWTGTASEIHPHVWAAIFLGGAICTLPLLMALTFAGHTLTRHVIAISQLLFSSLLIHITDGRIETHFHVFGSLAFLAFYRDWRVLITATLVTATDHVIEGFYFPAEMYGILNESLLRTAEHIGWVSFTDLFLLVSCNYSIGEMKENSLRQAQLQVAEGILLHSYVELEERVQSRTAALEKMRIQRELILNSAGEGIYGLDVNGNTTFVNDTAARLLGWESSDLIGQPMHSILHHTYANGSPYPKENCPIYKAIADGIVHQIDDEVFWRKDGSSFATEYISTPMQENQKVTGAVVTFQDISQRKKLEEEVTRLHCDLTIAYDETLTAYDATIEGWSRALDLRDHETEGHSRRVTEMTIKMGHALNLSENNLLQARRGALLHDIGKMGVPDKILLKPGPLDAEEWKIMRRHPKFAYDLLSTIPFLLPALDIPYCHHEKWDGTGYPCGLKGSQIPLAARLFAMVDVWDALCSDRPYRVAWSTQRVTEHIRSLAGTHFDPALTEIFLELLPQEASIECQLLMAA